ncbi:hypothetical protein XELAEV_18031456mg [Xenopus laevis]|uniref:Uncharacterized protein n=1 Tax=Xenopus laevis TaxID=8355 RepID=A0A974HG23_XENLA|nr:hypothetical protein XELAEV_18031456mg [Xenopus laevis]
MLMWQGPEQLLQEFVAKLNVNKFNLTFRLNYHISRLEFLYIEIKKDNQGLLSTNLFHKKIASTSLLHARSMHPPKCIEEIKVTGYKTRCLHRAYQQALAHNREDLLYKSQLILTFNENDKEVWSIIYKYWDILSKDPALDPLVTTHPLFCYKRNTSIGDVLTHNHFQKHSRTVCCKTQGSFKCGACEQCIYEHIRDIKNCNLLSAIAKHIYCIHNGQYIGIDRPPWRHKGWRPRQQITPIGDYMDIQTYSTNQSLD